MDAPISITLAHLIIIWTLSSLLLAWLLISAILAFRSKQLIHEEIPVVRDRRSDTIHTPRVTIAPQLLTHSTERAAIRTFAPEGTPVTSDIPATPVI